jgi:hypothetical protein
VVRDGGKVLVPLSSLHSDKIESSDKNDSAVANFLCSKGKMAEMSQNTKKKKPAIAPTAQKGTPRAAALEAANNKIPTATSGQKRSIPRKTSSGQWKENDSC